MAPVALVQVRKSYGSNPVVHGVDLDIADREFIVLVGPSGCGKSTILRMVAGLEDITAGEIRIGGRTVNEVAPKDRDIAMVFQDYALYPHMTVADNMAFSLAYRGVAKSEISSRVETAARTLEIDGLLARYPRQLSGGQRQRVAMGRAIVRNPQVFLFDEPLSNLDAKLRVAMRTEIKRLQDRVRTTTIYVTHDQVEAMTLADRIVVLNSGRVEQIGTPEEVYERPRTLFVAGFIGAPPMNLLPGRVSTDGSPAVEVDGLGRLPMAAGVTAPADGKVIVGIRPENLEWASGDQPAIIVAPAAVVEPQGSDTLVVVEAGPGTLQARLPPKLVRRAGEQVRLTVAAESIHVFAPTGARLGP